MYDVSVVGRHGAPLADADLRRLFAGSALTRQCLDRVREWPRILVTWSGRIVGAATCQAMEDELLVPDVGIDISGGGSRPLVLAALIAALENVCLAGGSRRVVMRPPPQSQFLLERRGYIATASCIECWVEKIVA